jgi:hypothetical protein
MLPLAFADTPVETTTQPTHQSSVPEPSSQTPAANPTPQQICMSECDAAETRCSSDVRRARAECSKRAANSGRDPFTMRNNDYTYFCGYFGNGSACGSGNHSGACRKRFSRTYGLCVDAIQNNIASMRYDCFQTERTAQTYCRNELRDCKATCK